MNILHCHYDRLKNLIPDEKLEEIITDLEEDLLLNHYTV